ncbi:Protein NRT1/ PTR FAMILY 5.2 [Hibiscus syriacus]|uniref:Protein NRT1/ PTR FAMILY 5.2 n=1 Tax=Hibiscus syriacus TaxID=106335 RepID=A0A6A3BCC8_HIBSY|nr:Protein NRT1/ PTR FAMILY 5.2 [Hibiscus syriacus]
MAVEEGIDDYTQDGTVDLRGNPVRRSKRGGWTACSFVVVYEVFERMAYYGISSNLVLYLTRKLHQGTVKSANNVTNWVGTIWITPIIGAYVADAHLGRYWTFVCASIIYICGMALLTLSVSVTGLKPPPCHQPNVQDCKQASTLELAVFSVHFLVYIQDNVGWTLGYGLPTIGLIISVIIFVAGTPFYRHRVPAGSPFTRMALVIVAASRKWRVALPSDPKELYELDWRVRLDVAREHGLVENAGQLPLTIFILLPQFVLMGTADAFLEVAKLEFFYDQAPESMKSLGTSYSSTSLGIGNFLSSFLLSTVSDITQRHGHQGWILNNLNKSHLDYYYAFFAVLNFLNFIFFVAIIKFYVYKAEVSDSMHVLTEELKVMRLKASSQEELKE